MSSACTHAGSCSQYSRIQKIHEKHIFAAQRVEAGPRKNVLKKKATDAAC
jgi:hypothetical protein